jgi:hypothetical protein
MNIEQGEFLFESIRYQSPEDVEKFIESIDTAQSFYVITKALEMAYSKGAYSLQESEILSKSIRILTKNLK